MTLMWSIWHFVFVIFLRNQWKSQSFPHFLHARTWKLLQKVCLNNILFKSYKNIEIFGRNTGSVKKIMVQFYLKSYFLYSHVYKILYINTIITDIKLYYILVILKFGKFGKSNMSLTLYTPFLSCHWTVYS